MPGPACRQSMGLRIRWHRTFSRNLESYGTITEQIAAPTLEWISQSLIHQHGLKAGTIHEEVTFNSFPGEQSHGTDISVLGELSVPHSPGDFVDSVSQSDLPKPAGECFRIEVKSIRLGLCDR